MGLGFLDELVFLPKYELFINGKLINRTYITKIDITDEIDNMTDSISISTIKELEPPKENDEIMLYAGRETLIFMGSYFVSSTTITNQMLSFKASGLNLNSTLKSKKSRAWERGKICGVVSKIAGENGLTSKCDSDAFISHEAQSNESDMSFLSRLAKERNMTFAIKNKTLIFWDKSKEIVAPYLCNIKETSSYSIEKNFKAKYKKATLKYQDTKSKKSIELSVGSGEPVLELNGSFNSKSEAKKFAQDKLDNTNKGTIRGSISREFSPLAMAGGKIVIANTLYNDGEYSIKRVSHSLLGGTTRIEFEG